MSRAENAKLLAEAVETSIESHGPRWAMLFGMRLQCDAGRTRACDEHSAKDVPVMLSRWWLQRDGHSESATRQGFTWRERTHYARPAAHRGW